MAGVDRGRCWEIARRGSARLSDTPALFEALIVPHRSLTRRGLWWVIGVITGLAMLISVRFWMLGAWLVLPFSVLEVGLVLLMLRLSMRQARASELILLTETELRIIRTDPSGRRHETVLQSGWLSVSLREQHGRVPGLMVTLYGRSEEIGRALGAAAKRDLADSLGRALHRARNPAFDNPQLRE